MRNNFNLKFSYGIGARNVLDTFKGSYTKDLIIDGTITVPFKLTDTELRHIRDKMLEIGFFDYPDSVGVDESENGVEITPFETYIFEVIYGEKEKKLHWENSCIRGEPEVEKLYELITSIEEIIESKPEYTRLPEARGGYC